ncbi:MAG TPA: META domain-containing protein [Pyrinomonadaceae bacterium]|nr:META domain-containing protein [Pyrinomonadaceae bacterium]
MKTNAIRMMSALASVVIIAASLTSAVTFAGLQKSSGAKPLSGTSWQLVKFQGPDERTFAPDDRSKYTITFGRNGRVTVRVDCNRGSSTWKVTANGELEFGSWSRTNAKCGPGSLHDQIVTEGADVHKFDIKEGRLFLFGMPRGGYYELEPHK